MDINYEKVLEKISRISGLDKEEVSRKIEAKKAKLSDLITSEGAAQIVAAELGIDFENEKLKINELLPSMRKVSIIGEIINLSPVRTFKNSKGEEGKVANLIIADDTSNIKVVLWDIAHISLIEKGELKQGVAVEIKNASMRNNELHLGSFSELKKVNKVFEKLMKEKIIQEKNISDFKISDNVKLRAFIVQSFEPRFFNVCPECKKKVVPEGENFICATHGKIVPERRALINLVLDDGTATIRTVLFHNILSDLGLKDLDDVEKLIHQREDLLGKEMIFSGQVRNNKFFNEPEFIVDDVIEVNVDELVEKLEKG